MSRNSLFARFLPAALLLAVLAMVWAPSQAQPQRLSRDAALPPVPPVSVALALAGTSDCDEDCDADLVDWDCALACWSGPNEPYADGCAIFDYDDDLDVDLRDIARFQAIFTGPLCPCDRDVNHDGQVNAMDLAYISSPMCWHKPASACPAADVDCSGTIDEEDLDGCGIIIPSPICPQ